MNDEEQIRALVVAYAERLDAGDLDGVAALFERGQIRSARRSEPLVGREAVRSMYDAVTLYEDGTPRTKHVLGNLEVECDDTRGEASASCAFVVMQADADDLRPVLSGRYMDRFERHGDEWWYAHRLVLPDLVGDLSAHMRQS